MRNTLAQAGYRVHVLESGRHGTRFAVSHAGRTLGEVALPVPGLHNALNAAGARASFVEIESDKGHDAFLLDEPVLDEALSGFLMSAAVARGICL